MIEKVDEHLRDWVEAILGPVSVSLAPPADKQNGPGVNLYLFELIDTPPARGTKRPPLQLSLDYLVTTWAEEPQEAHRLLGELVFAAMESTDFDVELEPLPATTWAAFGVPPQPSFVLRVPLRRERPEPDISLVRRPLVVRAAPTTSLHGMVVGPEDMPIAGAIVELPSLQRSKRTDTSGRFHFSPIPAQPRKKVLCIRAKGKELTVTVEQPTSESEPVVISFDPFNGKEK